MYTVARRSSFTIYRFFSGTRSGLEDLSPKVGQFNGFLPCTDIFLNYLRTNSSAFPNKIAQICTSLKRESILLSQSSNFKQQITQNIKEFLTSRKWLFKYARNLSHFDTWLQLAASLVFCELHLPKFYIFFGNFTQESLNKAEDMDQRYVTYNLTTQKYNFFHGVISWEPCELYYCNLHSCIVKLSFLNAS